MPLQYSDGKFVSFNKDGFDLSDRLESFYYLYHKILTEMIWFLNPQLIVSIKSHLGSDDVRCTQEHLNMQTLLPAIADNKHDFTLRSI